VVPNWESHLNPPADPWGDDGPPAYPTAPPTVPNVPPPPPPMYGRASVRPPPLREPTAELPALVARSGARAGRPAAQVSWRRTSRASLRSLSDGWGFTAAGLIVAFSGWGIWAAAGRGTGLRPLPGLVFVLLVGAGVFSLARLVGYFLIERAFGRPRLHARWSHFATFVFLAAAGTAYLLSTSWITDADDWLREGLDWVARWGQNL
jgi:hypothetical protein